MSQHLEMTVKCSIEGCAEDAIAGAESQALCRKHFIVGAYQKLESISSQIQDPQFHEKHGEATARILEDCMRHAADIACISIPPSNLERAQVLDVLLWASELHGRLRRSPRIRRGLPVKIRCEAKQWEENVETQILSRHGFQMICHQELALDDRITCERLDSGRRTEARVVWRRRKGSGDTEAGIEFLDDEDFWSIAALNTKSPEYNR